MSGNTIISANSQCVCYQLNAKNCPVHQDNRGSASNSSQYDPITQPFSYQQDMIDTIKGENAKLHEQIFKRNCEIKQKDDEISKLKEAYGVLREGLLDVTYEGHLDLCNYMKPYRPNYKCHVELAEEALAKAEGVLK